MKSRPASPAGAPLEMPAGQRFRSVGRSHVGRVRPVNEDRVLNRPQAALWAVADGMGGHAFGGWAAETVVNALGELDGEAGTVAVDAALAQVNRRIYDRHAGASGTTVVVLQVRGDHGRVTWLGDSRAYRWRAGKLELLTRDHTVVQQLQDAGAITADEATGHPRAHFLTRAVGIEAAVEPETMTFSLEPGDKFLLCSDGFHRKLSERDIAWDCDLDEQADRLLRTMVERDGTDNLTFVLIDDES